MIKTIIISLLLVWGINLSSQEYIGAGNDEGITISSSGHINNFIPENTINGSGMDAKLMEASRLLTQTTMGYNMDDVEHVATMGTEAWIEEQINLPYEKLTPRMYEIWDEIYGWNIDYLTKIYQENNPAAPITDEVLEAFDGEIFGPWALDFQYTWWEGALSADDQLRRRVAHALSQIMVISMNSTLVDQAESLTGFYDILMEQSFGSYRDLLEQVTLSPAMGSYLSHYNNPKEIPSENLHPDENYAREIMQLFSIGLFELNNDGSRKKDAQGNDIPTYRNSDIGELAKVFTGLGAGGVMENPWVDNPFFGMDFYIADKLVPMQMFEPFHEPGEKILLGRETIPAGQDGMTDIRQALDFLFNHPNVGPFISRQLIQRLIKSNPTPGYIDRVATVFNNNGQGERGDLRAVIKAILLDDEARSCNDLLSEDNGQLLEPLLRRTQLGSAFPMNCRFDSLHVVNGDTLETAPCPETRLWLTGFNEVDLFRQAALASPTVFNFYLPDHQPVGDFADRGLVGPEFKIHDSTTAINYVNSAFVATLWDFYGNSGEQEIRPDVGSLSLNTDILLDMLDDPEELYNYLDIVFTRGMLTDETRDILRTFIDSQPDWVDEWLRARGVLMLLLMSPDYTILK